MMYSVEWDIENNGIIFKKDSSNSLSSPRPVFWEELSLLGFDKYWELPKSVEPLLWNIKRKYYYKGELVAIAKGGNILEEPQIIITEKGKNLKLEPINIEILIEKNKKVLEEVEKEAIEFIKEVYVNFADKIDYFIVSYSGGKDSQVVLDLVSQALYQENYLVIFTDTTMEIPFTYEIFEKTKNYYQNLYPGLRILVAKNEKPAHELWKIFGPPSRIIRWCRPVYKTSPQKRLLRSLNSNKLDLKILIYNGVRAEESSRRKKYKRIYEKKEQLTVINASPILFWSSSLVFLYLFWKFLTNKELLINKGYRLGLNRIGCSVCPFNSSWSEFLINKCFSESIDVFWNIIKLNIHDLEKEEKDKYLLQGNWKKRAGGESLKFGKKIEGIQEKDYLKFIIYEPSKDFKEWFNIFTEISSKIEPYIELNIKGEKLRLELSFNGNILEIKTKNKNKNIINILKKLFCKIAYCIQCGVCEAECPTGAIKMSLGLKIESKYCNSCGKCLDVSSKGCLLSESFNIADKYKNNYNTGFRRYFAEGFKKDRLEVLLKEEENWFSKEYLSKKDYYSFVHWLLDSELITSRQGMKELTPFFYLIKEFYPKNPLLAWQLIAINLFYNSLLFNWYFQEIPWYASYSLESLVELVQKNLNLTPRNAIYGIKALFDTFESTPLGTELKLGVIKEVEERRFLRKEGTDNLHFVSVLYSLYRYAILKNKYNLRISELYKDYKTGGPYCIFGISQANLETILKIVNENWKDFLQVKMIEKELYITLNHYFKDYFEIQKEILKRKDLFLTRMCLV